MTISNNGSNGDDTILAETESYAVIESHEEDGAVYHIDFGMVTLHLYDDEYLEFIELIKQLKLK
jgi:hypothetical protein